MEDIKLREHTTLGADTRMPQRTQLTNYRPGITRLRAQKLVSTFQPIISNDLQTPGIITLFRHTILRPSSEIAVRTLLSPEAGFRH